MINILKKLKVKTLQGFIDPKSVAKLFTPAKSPWRKIVPET